MPLRGSLHALAAAVLAVACPCSCTDTAATALRLSCAGSTSVSLELQVAMVQDQEQEGSRADLLASVDGLDLLMVQLIANATATHVYAGLDTPPTPLPPTPRAPGTLASLRSGNVCPALAPTTL